MRRLALWAFRRVVGPYVVAYLYHGDQGTVVYTPEEVLVYFGKGVHVRAAEKV